MCCTILGTPQKVEGEAEDEVATAEAYIANANRGSVVRNSCLSQQVIVNT